MTSLRLSAAVVAIFCLFAALGCCQREKPPAEKPAPPAPAEQIEQGKPSENEEAEDLSAADPLEFDEPTDLDLDVQVGEEDEEADGPALDEDLTVE